MKKNKHLKKKQQKFNFYEFYEICVKLYKNL